MGWPAVTVTLWGEVGLEENKFTSKTASVCVCEERVKRDRYKVVNSYAFNTV